MGMHSHEHGVDRKLSIAVLINILLTVAQVVGGERWPQKSEQCGKWILCLT
jgi:hypothetical protein